MVERLGTCPKERKKKSQNGRHERKISLLYTLSKTSRCLTSCMLWPVEALHERERCLIPSIAFLTNESKPQYERSFKKWRVSKNVRKKERNFILGRLDERKRPTIVKVRGIVIPQARIEKQRLRKRETTFDLYKSRR